MSKIDNLKYKKAHWRFNGAKDVALGGLKDLSGNNNTLTILGTPQYVKTESGKSTLQCSDSMLPVQKLMPTVDGLNLADNLGETSPAQLHNRPFVKFDSVDNTDVVTPGVIEAHKSLDKTYAVLIRFPDEQLEVVSGNSDGAIVGGSASAPYDSDNIAIRYGINQIWWRGGGTSSSAQGVTAFDASLYGTWSWIVLRRDSNDNTYHLDTTTNIDVTHNSSGDVDTPSTIEYIGKCYLGGGPAGSSNLEFAGFYEFDRVLTDVETRDLVDSNVIPSDFIKGYAAEEAYGDVWYDLSVDGTGTPNHHDAVVTGTHRLDPSKELVRNGGFDNPDYWDTVGNVSIANGIVSFGIPTSDYSILMQTLSGLILNVRYTVSYTITAVRSSGTLYLSSVGFGGASTSIPSTIGRHSRDVICANITAPLRIIAIRSTAPDIDIDNISVKVAAGVAIPSMNALNGCDRAIVSTGGGYYDIGDASTYDITQTGRFEVRATLKPLSTLNSVLVARDHTKSWYINMSEERLNMFVGGKSATATPGTLPINVISTIRAVYDNGTITLFTNGVVTATMTGVIVYPDTVGARLLGSPLLEYEFIGELYDLDIIIDNVLVSSFIGLPDGSMYDTALRRVYVNGGAGDLHTKYLPAPIGKSISVEGREIVPPKHILGTTSNGIIQTDPVFKTFPNQWVVDGEFVSVPFINMLEHSGDVNTYFRTKELSTGEVIIDGVITENNTGGAVGLFSNVDFDPNNFSIVGKIRSHDNYSNTDRPILEKIDGGEFIIRIALVGAGSKSLSVVGKAGGVTYGIQAGSIMLTDGMEHVFMCSYDGTTWKTYVDGNLDMEVSDPVVLINGNNGCNIGKDGVTNFDDIIPELAIYNIALTELELDGVSEAMRASLHHVPYIEPTGVVGGITYNPSFLDPSAVFATRDGITDLTSNSVIVNHGAGVGKEITFDPSRTQYIEADIGETLNGQDYTMVAVVKVDNLDALQSILVKAGSGFIPPEGISIGTLGNIVCRHIDTNQSPTYTDIVSRSAVVGVGQPHLVVATYNATTKQHCIYVDGVLDKAQTVPFDAGYVSTQWAVGSNRLFSTQILGAVGALYSAALYNETKSAEWIEQLYLEESKYW